MKRPLLLSLSFLPLLAAAQVVWEDDFENYTPGTYIAENSGGAWTTWDNMPGTTQDALASDTYAHSGSVSANFVSPGGDGPTDFVHLFGDQTTGHYSLSFWIFVEAGAGGYFNILHQSPPAVPVSQAEWSLECYFHSDGSGRLLQDGDQPFTYTPAAWNEVIMDIDLDNDAAELWVEGTSVFAWVWSTQTDGSAGTNQLGGIDLWAAAELGDAALFWIDDIKLEVNTIGIDEIQGGTMLTFPNPADDQLTVELPVGSGITTKVTLVDVTGQVVRERAEKTTAADGLKLRMDLTGLPAGIYFLRVNDDGDEMIGKVVKH